MVLTTRILLAKLRKSTRKYLKGGFRDSLRIFVAGGAGGNGLPKFGGVGGQGGDIKVIGTEDITLNDVFKSNKSKRYQAQNGKHSSHNFILGPPGETLKLKVPVGVSLITEMGKQLGEINENGQELLLVKGGTGGNSKNGYLGTKGQEFPVILDLKLIADIGLVGFPNAGKSTILGAISHAKPKIASYPFTTIRPNVGIIHYPDFRQISMADLPGLIEGAYANKGMGHKFLKHVERTKLLLLVVDINGFQLSPQYPHRTCLENILLLNKELELYNKDLLEKPSMIVINKMDSDNANKVFASIKDEIKDLSKAAETAARNNFSNDLLPDKFLKFKEIIAISAKTNTEDVVKLKEKVRRLLDVLDQQEQLSRDGQCDTFREINEKLCEKGPKLI